MRRRRPSVSLSLIVLLAICAACNSASTSEVTTGPSTAKCQLTLAAPPNIVSTGGKGVVSITAQPECGWTVSTQAAWISGVSPSSGQGNGKVEFVAAANPVPTMREGEIVINDNPVRVMQEAAPCHFTLDPERRTLNAESGSGSFTIATHEACQWTARSNAEWLSVTEGVSGKGNGTVSYRVTSNGNDPRTGRLTIGDSVHTVIQQGRASAPSPAPSPPPVPNCTYTIAPTSGAVGAAGGAGLPVTVTTAANCPWTATSSASWLSITSGATGLGNGSVVYTAQFNGSGVPRTGELTIAGHAFSVSQIDAAPDPCEWDINPSSASFPASGGSGSITVATRSGCSWTASNNASWITFTSGSAGNAGGRVDFIVLPNPGAARSSTIAIAGRSFSVSQDGQ